ncbi:MAG: hypothetical protein ACLP41_08105, partial [Acidimicrobiales bacterium]
MGLGLSPSRFDVTTVAGSGGADRLVPGLAIDAVVADVALGVSEGARERESEEELLVLQPTRAIAPHPGPHPDRRGSGGARRTRSGILIRTVADQAAGAPPSSSRRLGCLVMTTWSRPASAAL